MHVNLIDWESASAATKDDQFIPIFLEASHNK